MFRLNRTSCRIGFLLFCLLPTALVIGWVLFPTSASNWEETISDQLGLDVSIQKASQPRPQATLLLGVELSDAELGPIAEIRVAEIIQRGDRRVVFASQPELDAARLDRVFDIVQERLLRQTSQTETRVQLLAGELTLRTSGAVSHPAETLTDVTCDVELGKSPQFVLSFRRVGQSASGAITLKIERRTSDDGKLSTRWSLDTGEAYLPTWILAAQLPSLRPLGESCEFRGMAWGEHTGVGSEMEVNGNLRGVDLYRLVQEQFPHSCNGTAEVQLVRARIKNGRLIDAAGTLRCSDGTVGRTLLSAAAKHWNLDLNDARTDEIVSFGRMEIGFECNASTLRLTGHSGTDGKSWLADGFGNSILSSRGVTTAPILSLVRVLVPQSDIQVPLTRETARLLSVFPVPAVKRPADQEQKPPSTTLRLEGGELR